MNLSTSWAYLLHELSASISLSASPTYRLYFFFKKNLDFLKIELAIIKIIKNFKNTISKL